jgi:hypothetical protein
VIALRDARPDLLPCEDTMTAPDDALHQADDIAECGGQSKVVSEPPAAKKRKVAKETGAQESKRLNGTLLKKFLRALTIQRGGVPEEVNLDIYLDRRRVIYYVEARDQSPEVVADHENLSRRALWRECVAAMEMNLNYWGGVRICVVSDAWNEGHGYVRSFYYKLVFDGTESVGAR